MMETPSRDSLPESFTSTPRSRSTGDSRLTPAGIGSRLLAVSGLKVAVVSLPKVGPRHRGDCPDGSWEACLVVMGIRPCPP